MPKDQGTDREGGKNMVIHAVTEPLFKAYGRVVEGYQLDGILQALAGTPVPADTTYVALEPALQNASGAKEAGEAFFGGMPFQMGYCNGHNTKLNCLEYHRDSEFNLGTEDFILLLARIDDIEDGKLDTGKVVAFRVPAGVLVEVYATTLHYAPCHVYSDKGFQVLVALPLNTNTDYRPAPGPNREDSWLWARNKWLLAHPDSSEAKQGAAAVLTGENIDIAGDL